MIVLKNILLRRYMIRTIMASQGRVRRRIFSVSMIFFVSVGMILSGCSKEKTVERKGPSGAGPCEVFDKLPDDIGKSVEVNYQNKIKLLGITVNELSPDKLKVSYYWQPQEDLGEYKQVFVHFTTPTDDKIVFQGDHAFCENLSSREIKGKYIKETYVHEVPQSAAGQEVSILVGIYAQGLKSAPRLEVVSAKWAAPVAGTAANVEKVNLKQ